MLYCMSYLDEEVLIKVLGVRSSLLVGFDSAASLKIDAL